MLLRCTMGKTFSYMNGNFIPALKSEMGQVIYYNS